MKLSDFDYFLPKKLIAQKPLPKRDESSLMVVSKGRIEHKKFKDVADYFSKGDVLAINDTKVFPAKLTGKKETGGIVKILLVKQINNFTWECIAQGRNLDNKKMHFDAFKKSNNKRINFYGTIRNNSNNKNKNNYNIKNIVFSKKINGFLDCIGETPLPPYIKADVDIKRYNTIYSRNEGSIAAPTAGLHFTKEILDKLRKKGIVIATITLHVGLGTFLPVKSKRIEQHKMHPEYFSISKEAADKINHREGKLFVVGTTSIRALESAVRNGKVMPKTGETRLFIYPGYKWKLDYRGLITNFHLPKSTLLMLVCAFIGKERIFEAYHEAIRKKYRFYSFGDGMLLVKQ